MRATIAQDSNNVDRIGSASNPGLRSGTLTRAQHRDRMAPKYRGTKDSFGTPRDLEELLDRIHGREQSRALVIIPQA